MEFSVEQYTDELVGFAKGVCLVAINEITDLLSQVQV